MAHGYPEPVGFVNDLAEVISPAAEADLEATLEEFSKNTGNEIAVATLKSITEGSIEAEAVHLFEDWKIGKASEDNGVLFLVVPEAREMRIEVGYGLEPVLTDSRAGNIIRDMITPQFKANNYDSGIVEGVVAIKAVLSGQELTQPAAAVNDDDGWLIFLIIFIIVLIIWFKQKKRQITNQPHGFNSKKSSWGGFSSGKSGGSFGGFSGGSSGGGGASGRW